MHIRWSALNRMTIFVISLFLLPLGQAAQSPPDAIAAHPVMLGDPARSADLPAALAAAYARGSRRITLTPGTYRIPPTGKAAILLENWRDATIEATGSTFIFEELGQRPVLLRHCQNVTLEGGTWMFAEPSFTQGRIKMIDADATGKFIDWQIDAGYPVFDPAKSTFDVVDQKTRLLRAGTGDLGCGSAEALGSGLFRLRKITGTLGNAAVNDWLFTRRPGGGASVIQLDDCEQCTMRGVTLRNSGFAAFFETDGEGGHHYLDCRVVPGPKPPGATEDQLVGCGADGFHSACVRIGPTIERCTWEGLLHDDCIAIHGSLQQVVRSEGLVLVLERGNKGGFRIGEPVRLSSKDGYFGEFTCLGLRILDKPEELLELTLDRPSGAPAAAKASNPRHNGAGFKIIGCTLGNCRSRGILVKADHGLIESCTISGTGMSAVSIGPEYYWGEADYSRKVVVSNNRFVNNVLNGSDAGVVMVHGDGAIGNGDLAIRDNRFEKNYGQITLKVEDTDGITITGNQFTISPLSLPGKSRTLMDFRSTKHISLQGNRTTKLPAGDRLINLGPQVEEITGNDATGLVEER